MTRRVCFALDMVDDADMIAQYERAHAPGAVWPEVTAGIRAAGYEAMEIWRAGDRLFMIAEVAAHWPARSRPRWPKSMRAGRRRWTGSRSGCPLRGRGKNGWR